MHPSSAKTAFTNGTPASTPCISPATHLVLAQERRTARRLANHISAPVKRGAVLLKPGSHRRLPRGRQQISILGRTHRVRCGGNLRRGREERIAALFGERLGYGSGKLGVHLIEARDHAAVAAERASPAKVKGAAGNVGHFSAGFFDKHDTRGVVLS